MTITVNLAPGKDVDPALAHRHPVVVNGELELVATIAGTGERITAIHAVLNPEKLAGAGI